MVHGEKYLKQLLSTSWNSWRHSSESLKWWFFESVSQVM
jgi:hypothetical protein